ARCRCAEGQPLYHAVGLHVHSAVFHGRRDAGVVRSQPGVCLAGRPRNCPVPAVLRIGHPLLSACQEGRATQGRQVSHRAAMNIDSDLSPVPSSPASGGRPARLAARLEDLQVANSYAELPPAFHTFLLPQPLKAPRLLHANEEVAAMLGLDPSALGTPEFLEVVSGQRPLPGGRTLAAVYSGHQFGIWAGQLGDGRAHLLGEVLTPHGPLELQLKGSGRTPYSRMGDGRAVLRSSVREYLASEAMAGLGIPTTRALALVVSDEPVYRETVETAAIVTRVSPSFVRFGSFEHWAGKPEPLQTLTDYVIDRHFPALREVASGEPAGTQQAVLRMLREVVRRTARMVADWQTVGFCHGVMNTDNMSILGLTIDYGPYGFMDRFQANHVCNHSDTHG